MRQIAPDVFQIPLMPRDGVNAYLVGDVLVDAGMQGHAKKILAALAAARIDLAAIVITHAHVDHVGGVPRLYDATGVPVSVGARDREACETGEPPLTPSTDRALLRGPARFFAGFGGFTVDAELQEGDDIGCGFTVLDTPGHSAGHVSFWRESDGVLLCGDVVNTMNLLTTRPGLQEPPRAFSPDPARNRESVRRIAGLGPSVVGAGHGPVLQDAAAPLRAFADALPAT